MIYKAYLEQCNERDCVIETNRFVIDIDASNISEARQNLRDLIINDYSNASISNAQLYEINNIFKMDMKGINIEIEVNKKM